MKINKIVCDICAGDIEQDEQYYTLSKVAPPKTPVQAVASISSITWTTPPERTALDVCQGCVKWLKTYGANHRAVQETL